MLTLLKYLVSKILKKIQIPSIKKSNIDKNSKICSRSSITFCDVGRYTYIGNNCSINHTTIGNFCSIADDVKIGLANHPIDWVSTSPVFHDGKNTLGSNFSNHKFTTYLKTSIGNDVWIGANCLIKSGVKIGNGSILGMGSVLTKDIGDFEIWAGNPARFIRKRFSEDIAEKLQSIEWWNYNELKIKNISKSFNNPQKLLEETESEK